MFSVFEVFFVPVAAKQVNHRFDVHGDLPVEIDQFGIAVRDQCPVGLKREEECAASEKRFDIPREMPGYAREQFREQLRLSARPFENGTDFQFFFDSVHSFAVFLSCRFWHGGKRKERNLSIALCRGL